MPKYCSENEKVKRAYTFYLEAASGKQNTVCERLRTVDGRRVSESSAMKHRWDHAWLKAALSPLQFQLAHEIAFSKRRAIDTENVVSRGRVEKEVR